MGPRDGTVVFPRRQQLDVHVSEGDGNYFGPIRCFGRGRLQPQDVTVEAHGFFEVGDGDADVGNAGLRVRHGSSVALGEAARGGWMTGESNI
jgi:hypothetical protein